MGSWRLEQKKIFAIRRAWALAWAAGGLSGRLLDRVRLGFGHGQMGSWRLEDLLIGRAWALAWAAGGLAKLVVRRCFNQVRLGLGLLAASTEEDFFDRARLGLSVGSWRRVRLGLGAGSWRLEKRTKDQKIFPSGAPGPWHGQLAAW